MNENIMTNWNDEQDCLNDVRQNGLALSCVRDQTPEICMAAVKECGFALKYVKEQTPEICIKAIKHDIRYKRYINIPLTDEMVHEIIYQTI